jgi:predicted MFS family arabinose efflux permease
VWLPKALPQTGAFMQKPASLLWFIILTAGTILAINMGIRQTFGLYLKPVTEDLQISREGFAFSIAVLNLLWGAGSPFAGALSDRFGALWVLLGGAALYAAGLVVMATSSGETGLLVSGVLIGLGIAGSGISAVLGVVGRAAPPEKRQMALSLTSMGSAIGQFLALPYVHLLMDGAGWAISLIILAATAAVMAPLGIALTRAVPGGSASASAAVPEQRIGAALSEAMKHPSFLLLTAGFFVCGFQLAAVGVHLPAYLSDKGFDPALAVIALTVVGITNIIGTYAFGRAGDFFPKRIALTLIYLGRGVIFLALLYIPLTETLMVLYAAILGLLWLSTVPLTSGLIVTFFGPRWLSMLYGIVFLSHQVGSFLGVWLGGWLYDRFQSYDMLWWAAIGTSLLAAALHMPISERPSPRLAMAPAE